MTKPKPPPLSAAISPLAAQGSWTVSSRAPILAILCLIMSSVSAFCNSTPQPCQLFAIDAPRPLHSSLALTRTLHKAHQFTSLCRLAHSSCHGYLARTPGYGLCCHEGGVQAGQCRTCCTSRPERKKEPPPRPDDDGSPGPPRASSPPPGGPPRASSPLAMPPARRPARAAGGRRGWGGPGVGGNGGRRQ